MTATLTQRGLQMIFEALQRGAHTRLLLVEHPSRSADAPASNDLVEHEEQVPINMTREQSRPTQERFGRHARTGATRVPAGINAGLRVTSKNLPVSRR